MTDSIPIIILNWNGLEDTIECMTSVLSMDYIPHEVILVDNGSGLEEQQKLQRLYGDEANVILVFNERNKGFTMGNADIVDEILEREWLPEYVVLLNNDTVIAPDWLVNLVSAASENNADIVSSKMVNYYNRSKIDNVGHFMLNTGEILPLGHGDPVENYTDRFENLGACGGAALYRTSMIQDIGFFDSHFNTGYEDAELGLRAKLLGYKCLFEPSAVVYHKVSRSINKVRDDAFLQRIQTNIFYTYVKLMPRRFLLLNTPLAIIRYLVGFLGALVTLNFTGVRLFYNVFKRFKQTDLQLALHQRRVNKRLIENYYQRIDFTNFFLLPDVKRIVNRFRARYYNTN